MTAIPVADPARAHPDAVRSIARWAAGLVNDGDTILLDASPPVLAMAPFLAGHRNLVVLTNGIEIGRLLAQNPSNRVLLTANVLRADGMSVIGPLHEPIRRSVQSATAFISCDGFSLAAGLTDMDADEALVKGHMVALARSTVALIDSTKYGRVYHAPFARADQLAHIFTDDGLEPYWIEQVQDGSIALTICRPAPQVEE